MSVPDLATVLARAAEQIGAPRTMSESVNGIVHAARESLPDIEHVGITIVHRDGRLETVAGTDELVYALDRLQYVAGEGPCLTALHDDDEPVTVVEHAARETRWGRFIPRAVELGLTSQLGVRLFFDDRTVGVLNLYSTSSQTVSAETRHTAELFATHAALAYGHARRFTDLQGALGTREVVGQAVGIVMERYGLSAERAFDYLVRVSSTGELKLRDVAREIVSPTASAAVTTSGARPEDAPPQ